MEEVDTLIIDSLRNINCDIDEEVSLKDFSSELVYSCFVQCLKNIKYNVKYPLKLPHSMSQRLKLATDLANTIKELGYRGDMGYQTILYSNEAELRRILMFLIERIPRDNKIVTDEKEEGYVAKLVKLIEERNQESLLAVWVPSSVLNFGIRETKTHFLRQNYGSCFPLQTEIIKIPRTQGQKSEVLTNFWIHNLPPITKQFSLQSLIPSLLFSDASFSHENLLIMQNKKLKKDLQDQVQDKLQEMTYTQKDILQKDEINNSENIKENQVDDKTQVDKKKQEINTLNNKINNFQRDFKTAEAKLTQIKCKLTKKEENLKEIQNKIELKKKTLIVLSKHENLVKLKKIVENGSQKLIDLAEQWNSVVNPLLEEYRTILNNHNNIESAIIEKTTRLQNLHEKRIQIENEIKEKELKELQILQEYEKKNKTINRSMFTKRIIEIIGSIKKQEEDIKKILNDTREIQKELNNLNGKLERSFTLADELIFRDAKRDETARKSYKLLATLHSECNKIVQTITDIGTVEREVRNIQDQVDTELGRETASKLERVLFDLSEVKKENAILAKQIQEQ